MRHFRLAILLLSTVLMVSLFQNCSKDLPASVTNSSSTEGTNNNNNAEQSLWELTTNLHVVSKGNGNVGIGTSIPSERLEVNGRIKAERVDTSSGAFISISLNHCGPSACSGYHTLNEWKDISTMNYNWAQSVNTAPDIFTTNGTGRITLLKTGLYKIRLGGMFIPSVDHSNVTYVCPSINGSINCGSNVTNALRHNFYHAGYWTQMGGPFEFTLQLNANTTVAWAYYPMVALNYWAHDLYTNIEITKIN